MKKSFVLLASALLLASGCNTFTSPARKHELNASTPYWFDYAAQRRGALAYPKASGVVVCAEPSPDVALDIIGKFNLEANQPSSGVTAKAGVDINEKVVQLAKRTQTIMFLRESLYRLCEMSANQGLKPEDVVAQYSKVIDAAVDMAKAELLNAEQAKLEADANLQKIMNATPQAIDTVQ